MDRLGNGVENRKRCSLKFAREGCCACPRLTVLSAALCVQKVLLFLSTFSSKSLPARMQ